MGDVIREEHDDPELQNLAEGDSFLNFRKRRLTMALKLGDKSEKSLEEMILEWGIRGGSINWMVVTAMSSWRSGNYSEVLINYFGENAVTDEGSVVETNAKRADEPNG
jgi:hypothetical protein